VLAQIGLGVATLLMVVPLHLALTHQLMAMVVLAAALWHLDRALSVTPAVATTQAAARALHQYLRKR